MRILQVIPSFDLAGAEVMCADMCIQAKKSKNEIYVISLFSRKTSLSTKIEKEGIPIFFLNKRRGIDLSIFKKIKRLVLEINPDVIHTHLGALKYVVFALKNKYPIVHTVHNVASKENSWLEKKLCKKWFKNNWVLPVALSQAISQSIINLYSIEYQIPIITNGIDFSKCISKKNYMLDGKIVLINVARFSEQKNHIGLLKAMSMLNHNHNFELHLVGDGQLRPIIESEIRRLSLDNQVILHGNVDNVFPLLAAADVFVLPSNYEGVPISIIEAMGTGLPIIASKVGGIPNIIKDGETGLLCETNPESIAESIEKLVDNTNLRLQLGLAAKDFAFTHFSSEHMFNSYFTEAYSRVANIKKQ
jgi:glycosyltransferase involved in cell wall biosynthesis